MSPFKQNLKVCLALLFLIAPLSAKPKTLRRVNQKRPPKANKILATKKIKQIPIQKHHKKLEVILKNKGFLNTFMSESDKSESNKIKKRDFKEEKEDMDDLDDQLQLTQPVVGILTIRDKWDKRKSYFFGSYAKWVESVGIRWVPLFLQETGEQLRVKLKLIDGVLLTGGVEDFRNL